MQQYLKSILTCCNIRTPGQSYFDMHCKTVFVQNSSRMLGNITVTKPKQHLAAYVVVA